MHNVETQSSTAQRFCSRDNIEDPMQQQITPNHISREYEDYTGSQNRIDKGSIYLKFVCFFYFYNHLKKNS